MAHAPIEKLFRKELRLQQFDNKAIRILERPPYAAIAACLLQSIFKERLIVEIVQESPTHYPTSLEEELTRQLREFFEGRTLQLPAAPLMQTIPEELLKEFAAARKIAGTFPEHDDLRNLLEQLQGQQPQTKHALQKSFAHLGEHTKKQE